MAPGDPSLTPGFRYAYIVTASDPNNTAIFRNGGRSEVGYFTYRLPVKVIPGSSPE